MRINKTIITFVLLLGYILFLGLYGLDDAQALDESATFVTNFADNVKTGWNLIVCFIACGFVALPKVLDFVSNISVSR